MSAAMETISTNWGTIANWVAIGISVVALFQPYIIAYIKRANKKIDFEIYRKLEVGYNSYGPTIGILGTLSCYNAPVKIKELQIELIRARDKATHKFSWFVEKPTNSILWGILPEHQTKIEIVTPFTLLPEQDKKVFYLCNDSETQQQMERVAEKKISDWKEIINRDRELAGQPDFTMNLINSADFQSTREALSRLNYWEVDKYEVRVTWVTKRDCCGFKRTYSIELQDRDVKKLDQNSSLIMLSALQLLPENISPAFCHVDIALS